MAAPSLRLSVLDQAPVPSGSTPAEALANSVSLAQHVDQPSATTASGTPSTTPCRCSPAPPPSSSSPAPAPPPRRIRIGSGGIMLPHYSPYKVAELFQHPRRLLPRPHRPRHRPRARRRPAGMHALRRNRNAPQQDDFPQQLAELLAFLHPEAPPPPSPPTHPFSRREPPAFCGPGLQVAPLRRRQTPHAPGPGDPGSPFPKAKSQPSERTGATLTPGSWALPPGPWTLPPDLWLLGSSMWSAVTAAAGRPALRLRPLLLPRPHPPRHRALPAQTSNPQRVPGAPQSRSHPRHRRHLRRHPGRSRPPPPVRASLLQRRIRSERPPPHRHTGRRRPRAQRTPPRQPEPAALLHRRAHSTNQNPSSPAIVTGTPADKVREQAPAHRPRARASRVDRQHHHPLA